MHPVFLQYKIQYDIISIFIQPGIILALGWPLVHTYASFVRHDTLHGIIIHHRSCKHVACPYIRCTNITQGHAQVCIVDSFYVGVVQAMQKLLIRQLLPLVCAAPLAQSFRRRFVQETAVHGAVHRSSTSEQYIRAVHRSITSELAVLPAGTRCHAFTS